MPPNSFPVSPQKTLICVCHFMGQRSRRNNCLAETLDKEGAQWSDYWALFHPRRNRFPL